MGHAFHSARRGGDSGIRAQADESNSTRAGDSETFPENEKDPKKMNVKFDFADKIVLVTGGGSGIGLASSKAFAAAGGPGVVADLSKQNGSSAVAAIRAAGGNGEFLHVDVAEEAAVIDMIEHIRS